MHDAASVRLLLVDDHPAFRAGLRSVLQELSDIQIVGEADCADAALRQLAQTSATLVLLDLSLPDQSGMDLMPRIKARFPHVNVLFLSAHPEASFALPLLKAGAQGYLCKSAPPEEIRRAVRLAAKGERYLSGAVMALLADTDSSACPHRRLSRRELQIFTRIARGLAPSTTAAELNLSVKTIGTYRSRIMEKLGMSSNAELAAYAVRNHLLDQNQR